MTTVQHLISTLEDLGVSGAAGVPCSLLGSFTECIDRSMLIDYLPTTQEGDAVSLAAGAWLAGSTVLVFAQNSGLGNLVNPIATLLSPAQIPVPMVITWRGEPGRHDEPQHRMMGEITPAMLDLLDVEHRIMPSENHELSSVLSRMFGSLSYSRRSQAVVVKHGHFTRDSTLADLRRFSHRDGQLHDLTSDDTSRRYASRRSAIALLSSIWPQEGAIVCSTGKASRELFEIDDSIRNFYTVGAMGSAGTLGTGVSLYSGKAVLIIDGDGSALMRLGGLAVTAAYGSSGLVHVVLDNGVHGSTGGQVSLSSQVSFPGLALACGYAQVYTCSDLSGLERAVKMGIRADGPVFVHMRIGSGETKSVGRPTIAVSDLAQRFRDFCTGGGGSAEGHPPTQLDART